MLSEWLCWGKRRKHWEDNNMMLSRCPWVMPLSHDPSPFGIIQKNKSYLHVESIQKEGLLTVGLLNILSWFTQNNKIRETTLRISFLTIKKFKSIETHTQKHSHKRGIIKEYKRMWWSALGLFIPKYYCKIHI